jgi:hypothetical protein
MKKIYSYFLIVLILVTVGSGCRTYRQETLSSDDFYYNKQLQHTVDKYNVYVHDGQNSYKITAPVINGDTVTGTLVKINSTDIIKRPKGRKELAKHRKELNVYLKKNVDTALITNAFKISKIEVDRVDAVVKNKKSFFALFAGIALLIILTAVLIYGLITIAVKGSDESSNQSGDSSADSSNDSSNDSSKGSGCYVATMVYGSYEAPEVLVLRKFRDHFLAHYALGRSFIRWYYTHSPSFVERYKKSPVVNTLIRFCLNGLVKFLSKKP